MPDAGWKQMVAGAPWFQGPDKYPIAAYSEFMPPPRLGRKPYETGVDPNLFADKDPWGWYVSEAERHIQLRPGLEQLAREIGGMLVHLGRGEAHGISRNKLEDNPYWPAELAAHAGKLHHERYVLLMPLALSRTQDDKGRVRWTLFGSSEQGPARAFWRSFFTSPNREVPEDQALAFIRELLSAVYGEPADKLTDLRRAGLRILPATPEETFPCWREDPLPGWTEPFLLGKGQPIRGVKYLLTFRPFGDLPEAVRKAYLAGELHLLPFPGSLWPWG